MTLNEIITEVKSLSIEERQQLMHVIVDSFTPTETNTKSLRDFRGVAEHMRDMDAQEYVNQLRDEWDERSWKSQMHFQV